MATTGTTNSNGGIPKGWQRVRLGNVARFVNGRAFRPEDWGTYGLPIVRIQNLTSPHAPYNFFNGEVANDNLINDGDIVISWSASLETRTWQRGLAVLNQHIFKVIDYPSIVGRRFLYHLLQLTMFSLRQLVHGTTMQHITKGNFDSTRILLPPLTEQRAIAAVLDSIDDTIERTESVIAATEQLRDSLLHQLLTRGVPGWHTEWKEAPGLGTIPAGWEVVRLGEVATLQRGMDLPEDDRISGSVPVYGSNGVHGFHDMSPVNGPGVITGRSGSIGLVHYCESSFWPLNTTLFVKDFHGNNERFIFHFLSNLQLERFAASTGVPSLNRNFVHPTPVGIPPLSEQKAIVRLLDGVDKAVAGAKRERDGLKFMKESTADALLTGRVRVGERDA